MSNSFYIEGRCCHFLAGDLFYVNMFIWTAVPEFLRISTVVMRYLDLLLTVKILTTLKVNGGS